MPGRAPDTRPDAGDTPVRESDSAPDSAPPSIPSAAAVDPRFDSARAAEAVQGTGPSAPPPPPPSARPATSPSVRPSSEAAAELSSGEVQGFHTPAPVLPGHVIADRYEVVSVLGEGGMGIVYRCRDQATGDFVAIKRVIPPDGKLASDYILWFYKEARALASLNHPCIVRARDFGQLVDTSPYLAMDLVSGVSLHDLAQVRLSFPLIWSVIDQILGALAHAHARGIVHGDLKPSNVLVEEMEGQPPDVHILDFGLAWLKQDLHDERLDGEKAMEFAPHAGAGTPGYMAPEQIQHEMHHVSGPTDLYAIGCVLYKLLSGHAPFSGDPKELLRLHAFEKPPPLKINIDAPRELTTFVHRLLAKRPWDRWEFAAEARNAWAAWRPPSDLDPKVYRFPPLRRGKVAPAPTTRKTGPRGPSPELGAKPERAPGLLSIRPSPLVGRDEIRQKLREVCDDVAEGNGSPHRLVILVGPAGVGKSRIGEWLCEVVHEEGTMVPLRARYRPVRGPLDGMLGAVTQHFSFERVDRDVIERSLLKRWKVRRDDKNGRAWVAGAAEWIRPDQAVGPTGVRFALDTLETRRTVIRYTLRRIANRRPLLFWLDDLHHAPATTLEGLVRIHEDEPDQRIVMLATVRAEDVQLGTPAAERLRQLRESLDGIVLEVNPMNADETAALLRESLPLDDAAVTEAARRSRGNPLFALQQLHAWALAGNMEFKGGAYRVPSEVLALRPQTTAELWDSRVAAMPAEHQLAAYAVAPLGVDVRGDVVKPLLGALGLPADQAMQSLQSAEILLPRGPGRYSWPHALLQEHLLGRLVEREEYGAIFQAAADALTHHPMAGSRRIVRQRVMNLLYASKPDAAAQLLFDFLQNAWNGAREPLATLADLELLKGRLRGRSLALKHRWQAEALRHLGRNDEATTHAEIARSSFEELGDRDDLAHCLRVLGHLASERGESAEGLLLVNLALQLFSEQNNLLGQAQCEAVIGEIEYLLGNYEQAREVVQSGVRHFAALGQPLGRGQCLLLLSWVDHSEGATERARRLTLEARGEFERAGYRLGQAQADASLAHVEHRLMNYYSAEVGAYDALAAFDALRTPRGQAACERLLAMVGLDTDDIDMAELHAERAKAIYGSMGDPWGIVESKLISCQIELARRQLDQARVLLEECCRFQIEEAEPKQHLLLTRAWLEIESDNADEALEILEEAAGVFDQRSRAGDHTPHLLGRLARKRWPAHALGRIDAWRALLNDRSRRNQT